METVPLLDPTNVVSATGCKLMICKISRHLADEIYTERNVACASFDAIKAQLRVKPRDYA